MEIQALLTNEIAANGGFTHRAIFDADDLTTTATNTAQTIKICDLAAGDIIEKLGWRAKTFFKDASDAAFNTTTMSVGDNSTVTTHIAAIELNVNGTEVAQGYSNTAVHYAAANTLKVTFNAMSGKALNDIDTGEVIVFFKLNRMAVLETATQGAVIEK